MNSIIFCLLLVSMVVMNNVGVEARKQFIGIGILDPCRRPGGWHPGCPIHTGKVVLFIRPSLLFLNPLGPIPAVCSRILRCRHGHKKDTILIQVDRTYQDHSLQKLQFFRDLKS
ncbi:unnamed protein product [Malus baccata var. baccata]